MSGYISNLISTPRGQLITTAVFSGAAVATLIFGYQALEREERLSALKNSIPSINDGKHHTSKVGQNSGTLSRNYVVNRLHELHS